MSLKNPVTPLGIDPRTARIVAQRLNLQDIPGHNTVLVGTKILKKIFKRDTK